MQPPPGPGGGGSLDVWTVYDNPKDYPGWFVARRFTLDGPTGDTMTARRLEDLRNSLMTMGLTCIPRSPEDDPVIVESWI